MQWPQTTIISLKVKYSFKNSNPQTEAANKLINILKCARWIVPVLSFLA
jgi:hypothetical protein